MSLRTEYLIKLAEENANLIADKSILISHATVILDAVPKNKDILIYNITNSTITCGTQFGGELENGIISLASIYSGIYKIVEKVVNVQKNQYNKINVGLNLTYVEKT